MIKRKLKSFMTSEDVKSEKENNPFFSNHYQKHNLARLQHLETIEFDMNRKKILDIGAGVGDHSIYYLFKNCSVTALEGRQDLVKLINSRFGSSFAHKVDFEFELDELKKYTGFDYVHCYGLLYHLSNPELFLESIVDCGKILLLETCLSFDDANDDINLVDEGDSVTQAISRVGCRPKRTWVFNKLKELFPYVYIPKTQPDHEEFPLQWNMNRGEGNVRAIFVASHYALSDDKLSSELLPEYSKSL